MQWERIPHRLKSAFRGSLPVEVVAPQGLALDAATPLLWVHDGPAYDQQAELTAWVGDRIEGGHLPPMRVVLAGVRRRTQWYSASPRYLRSFSMGLTQVGEMYACRGPVVVMGASLGGLTSLLAGLSDGRVGGVFAQSGSFFTAHTDGQESGFARFDRITAAVDDVSGWSAKGRTLSVAMTCGTGEENVLNNRLMATHLAEVGVDVSLREVAGGHDYPSWNAALDPSLTQLLNRLWSYGPEGSPH